jgi:beta-lactamase class A
MISLALALTLSVTAAAQTPASTTSQTASDPALQRLDREIARLSTVSGGVVGVTAIHLETGRRVSMNGTERFPMASTFKVPIAVQLLTRIDKGEVKLDQMIDIKQSDLHPGSGTLADLFNKGGLALSVRNLMELMLLISDNSATDVMLRTAGGAEAVTARMRSLGIEGINVNRSTAQLIADWVGVANLPPEDRWNPAVFFVAFNTVKPEDQKAAAKKFDADPRDTSTPDGMAALLERIYHKDLLKPESAELLLDIMRRCRTGETRLRGLLPQGTEIAHKTGTIGGTTNDVGIITLPDSAGHIAIAVFVKSSEKEVSARERGIAEIARAVHDFFLFQPRAGL